jgi:hypothetical protein
MVRCPGGTYRCTRPCSARCVMPAAIYHSVERPAPARMFLHPSEPFTSRGTHLLQVLVQLVLWDDRAVLFQVVVQVTVGNILG